MAAQPSGLEDHNGQSRIARDQHSPEAGSSVLSENRTAWEQLTPETRRLFVSESDNDSQGSVSPPTLGGASRTRSRPSPELLAPPTPRERPAFDSGCDGEGGSSSDLTEVSSYSEEEAQFTSTQPLSPVVNPDWAPSEPCPLCPMSRAATTFNQPDLLNHLVTKHDRGLGLSALQSQTLLPKASRCDHCGRLYANSRGLLLHQSRHSMQCSPQRQSRLRSGGDGDGGDSSDVTGTSRDRGEEFSSTQPRPTLELRAPDRTVDEAQLDPDWVPFNCCPLCPASRTAPAYNRVELLGHLTRQHDRGVGLTESQCRELLPAASRCDQCGRLFATFQGVQVHKNRQGSPCSPLRPLRSSGSMRGRAPLLQRQPSALSEDRRAAPTVDPDVLVEVGPGMAAENLLPGPWAALTADLICLLPAPERNLPSAVARAFRDAANRVATLIEESRGPTQPRDHGLARLLLVMPKLTLTPLHPKRWTKRAVMVLKAFPNVRQEHVDGLIRVATSAHQGRRSTVTSKDSKRAKACQRVVATTGSLSKGVRAFLSNGLEPVNAAMVDKLRRLHPLPRAGTEFPRTRSRNPTPTYTADQNDVQRKVLSVDASTAAGFDGWTPRLVIAAASIVSPDCRPGPDVPAPAFSPLLTYLTHLANDFGRCAPIERQWHLTSRLLPFSKTLPGSVRPVAVPTLFSRISKLVGLELAEATNEVHPYQYGLGDGADALVHRIRARLDSKLANVAVSLDAENAFNNLSRSAMARETKSRVPALYHLVEFCYAEPTPLLLITDSGEVERISSAQGVQQGCNLGSLMMTLVIADRVRELIEKVPELDVDSYVDDMIGLAKLEVPSEANADALLERVLAVTSGQQWVDDGIFINAVKTVTRTAEQLITSPLPVAGAWVGGEAAVSDLMNKALDDLLPPFARVRLLPKQLALAAVRYCCVPLIQHWLRTHPPAVVAAPAARFDRWICSMIAGIAELPVLSETAVAIIGLPLREGGLGCLPQLAIAPLAYAASLITAIATLTRRAEWRAEIYQLAHNTTVPDTHLIDWLKSTAPRSVTLVSRILKKTPEEVWDSSFSTTGLQRDLTAEWGKDRAMEVLLSLDTAALQARFLDQASSLGKGWLVVIPTSDHRMRLSNAEVRLALRMRLHCGMYPDYSPMDTRQCVCASTTAQWSPEHALACMHGAAVAARTLRHTYVKHILADHMRAGGLHPVVEASMPVPDQPQRPKSMDIVVAGLNGNDVQYIDVSVVSPLRSSQSQRDRGKLTPSELVAHINRLEEQRNRPGAKSLPGHINPARNAAVDLLISPSLLAGVRIKKAKYDTLVRQQSQTNHMATGSLTPCIISTGGTVHPDAHKLLSSIANCSFQRKRDSAYDYNTVTSSLRTKSHYARSLTQALSCALVRKLSLFFRKSSARLR